MVLITLFPSHHIRKRLFHAPGVERAADEQGQRQGSTHSVVPHMLEQAHSKKWVESGLGRSIVAVDWTSAGSTVPYAWRAQKPGSYAIRSEKRGWAYRISPRLRPLWRNRCEHSNIVEIIVHFKVSVKGCAFGGY